MSSTVGMARATETAEAMEPAVDAAAMRDVLGHFASGVVVVTARGPSGPIGFTCQSFTSLSLDPPLVSFAPSRASSTWPRIREVGTFCVNILAADQERHSAGFARSGVDKFAGVRWRPSRYGAPVLEGACAWVHCRLHSEHDGGDHTIVLGRVLELAADHSRTPLLYHRGAYELILPRPREESR
ncbi:flavin reductase family protein [Pseudonocardia alaniniphila]|uniref:Flavin reductase family protein n=1 Tax=Pseudonocardia alaniniphila TaxID=75291 RepID=A0ABS9TQQ9_9PSEU|nr:flavin reductase family protein [Pseudonocardia alaniniphila]MCH6170866.1 flavin reductase family protein [Pseudonocardia alaniniphila]